MAQVGRSRHPVGVLASKARKTLGCRLVLYLLGIGLTSICAGRAIYMEKSNYFSPTHGCAVSWAPKDSLSRAGEWDLHLQGPSLSCFCIALLNLAMPHSLIFSNLFRFSLLVALHVLSLGICRVFWSSVPCCRAQWCLLQ